MSWPMIALGDLFEIARGGSPRPIENFITLDKDGINWIMISDASDSSKYISDTKRRILESGVKSSRMVYPGDFLLTNSMSFGRPYIMRTTGCIHDGWLVLSNKKKNTDPNYFYHLLSSNTLYQEFAKRAAGSTVKNLNIDLVRDVQVPLPPIEEQKRIALILDQADLICRLRRHATQQIEIFLQSVFVDMFGNIARNSKNWHQIPTGEIFDIQLGKMLDQKRITGQYLKPYLGNSNVQWGRFKLDDVKYMDFDETDFEKFKLKKGDILVCEGGEVGRTAIWNAEIQDCCYQKALHRLRPIKSSILPEYFLYYMWFACLNGLLEESTSQVSIAHFTAEKFKDFKILVPPIESQQKFAEIYTNSKLALRRSEEAERQAEALFQSLLHLAFTGQLLPVMAAQA